MTEPTSTGRQYPIQPTEDMRVAAISCRQLYTALTEEGFTEYQALVILGQLIFTGRQA